MDRPRKPLRKVRLYPGHFGAIDHLVIDAIELEILFCLCRLGLEFLVGPERQIPTLPDDQVLGARGCDEVGMFLDRPGDQRCVTPDHMAVVTG